MKKWDEKVSLHDSENVVSAMMKRMSSCNILILCMWPVPGNYYAAANVLQFIWVSFVLTLNCFSMVMIYQDASSSYNDKCFLHLQVGMKLLRKQHIAALKYLGSSASSKLSSFQDVGECISNLLILTWREDL
ncbi:hypothetical protein FCV25MIE_21260 [Fagus crenata]|jgi:hypothetical protein